MCTSLDAVVTGRMHLAIACLGQSVPAACISYQDKVEGLYQLLGLEGLAIDAQFVHSPDASTGLMVNLIEKRH